MPDKSNMRLTKLLSYPGCPGPLLLIVMDGVGLAPPGPANAVSIANTPVLDRLLASEYQTALHAHGTHVGLTDDSEMGNSEVGHNTLGGGRVFVQGAKLTQQALQDGSIFTTDTWREVEARGKANGTVHFLGLLSDGNVHAHIDHLFTLLKRCVESGVRSVCVHTLLDGRDVAPRSALGYLQSLEERLAEINQHPEFNYRIASAGGRMKITMDRYHADWAMVKKGFDAHVHGIGQAVSNARQEVQRQYDADPNINDQFLEPFVVVDVAGKPLGTVQDGDAVVLFNFRGDRAIEISQAFEDPNFEAFDRGTMPKLFFCGMLQYDGDLHIPRHYLVNPPIIEQPMLEFLCAERLKTFAVSETQKFGHVTYFWNGNRSSMFDENLETWVEIPSDSGDFSKAPAMKAEEITDATIELLRSKEYRFGRINFANGDMVGHSGDIDATVRAIESVDQSIGRLLDVVAEQRGVTIVTADHGNADQMFVEKNGERVMHTAHSLNPVPFVIVDSQQDNTYAMTDLPDPGLANVAATVFNLLGYCAPEGYMHSLINFPKEPIQRYKIYRGGVVDLGLETVRLPNDEIHALEIVRQPDGSVIIAQDDSQQVCLIRQFRHAAGGWIWEFPAGGFEAQEQPLETAKRELQKKTGCQASTWKPVGSMMTAPSFCNERLHIFLATNLTIEQPELKPYECIEVHWKPLSTVVEMAQQGEIDDAKTIVALFRMMQSSH